MLVSSELSPLVHIPTIGFAPSTKRKCGFQPVSWFDETLPSTPPSGTVENSADVPSVKFAYRIGSAAT